MPNFVPETTNISYIESSDAKLVPVPKGYTASKIEGETSVNGGFVIYEGEINWDNIEINNLTDNSSTNRKEKEQFLLQSNYNQYVWVPVNEEDIQTIYGVDSNGKLWGKLYSYSSETRTPQDWTNLNGKIRVNTSTNYFEPGLGYGANSTIVNEMDIKTELNKTRQELTTELEQTYYQTIKSIKKYGGFYIGRYETGIVDNNAVIQKMNENIANQSWAEMYQKTQEIKGEKDHVITSMIWSSLWDYTVQWFINTGAKENKEIYSSKTWGNYKNSELEYYADKEGNVLNKTSENNDSKKIPAGSSENTKSNNIYDMAGNVNELTLGCYGYYFSYRGGYYDSASEAEMSCSYRGYQRINDKAERTGSRAILLLK